MYRHLALALCLVGLGNPALASIAWWTSGDEDGREAFVGFEKSGDSTLTVTLVNSSSRDALVPTDVLTAVFFSLACDGPDLTPISALMYGYGGKSDKLVVNGQTIIDRPAQAYTSGTNYETIDVPDGNVGGEWAYARTDVTPPGPGNHGISSAGYDVFGAGNFGGANLAGPEAVNGLQYGISSLGDNPSTGNGGLNTPLVKNAVVFTLSGFTGNLSDITGVRFQYGTSLDEPFLYVPADQPISIPAEQFGEVPEPGSMVMWLLLGLTGAAAGVVRHRRLLAKWNTGVGVLE
jgi:hypothetical protein